MWNASFFQRYLLNPKLFYYWHYYFYHNWNSFDLSNKFMNSWSLIDCSSIFEFVTLAQSVVGRSQWDNIFALRRSNHGIEQWNQWCWCKQNVVVGRREQREKTTQGRHSQSACQPASRWTWRGILVVHCCSSGSFQRHVRLVKVLLFVDLAICTCCWFPLGTADRFELGQ